jgi:hypothetical protein
MTLYKGSLFYSLGAFGWSENYWLEASTYSAAGVTLDNINDDRLALCHSAVTAVRGRVGDPGTRGDAYLVTLSTTHGTYSTAPTATSMPVDVCLGYRFSAASVYFQSRWLRAVPIDQFPNGVFTPTGPFLAALANWDTELTAFTFLNAKNKNPPPPTIQLNPTNSIFIGIRNRKTGRPFGQPVGRRRIA